MGGGAADAVSGERAKEVKGIKKYSLPVTKIVTGYKVQRRKYSQ